MLVRPVVKKTSLLCLNYVMREQLMKITKTKLAAASFGAALTSVCSAPELSAQVVDLTFTPSVVPFNTQLAGSAVVFGIPTSDGVSSVNFNFFNDSIGRTFFGSTGAGAASFAAVDPGDVFSGFVPADGGGQTFTSAFFPFGIFMLGTGVTGIETFGFVLSGQAGFFRVDFGQPGGPVTFLDGQLAVGGSSITIPEVPTAVPEPSSVGLTALALGAVGLRRRRKVA